MNNRSDLFRQAKALANAKLRIIFQAGDNSVVDNQRLPKMPQGSRVIISNEVYETMKLISDVSNEGNFEVPFLLFGHSEGQTVFFDDIEADVSESDNKHEAVFSKHLINKLENFCSCAKKYENKIVAHGHSHPRSGNWYLNYSISDINAYITFRDRNEKIKDKVDVCGCLLTGGNYNFVFYDGNDTYRFDEVFRRGNDGKLYRLHAFGPDTSMINNRQNYMGM